MLPRRAAEWQVSSMEDPLRSLRKTSGIMTLDGVMLLA